MASLPQRKSPRLTNYDYSQAGAYFVTICTHQRQQLFGYIADDTMLLNTHGEVAHNCILAIEAYWDNIAVDLFVVMPNHVHMIIIIFDDDVGTAFLPSEKTDTQKRVPTLGQVVGNYKSAVTRSIRQLLKQPDLIVWQNRYHDHIIRNERGLTYIRDYIFYNPQSWLKDSLYE